MIGLIEKMIGLISIGSALANISVLNRFLAGVATVIALTIISSVMAGLLVVAAFFGIYAALTYAGLESNAAIAVVALLAVAVTALTAWLTVRKIRLLQSFATAHRPSEQPVTDRLHGIASAFLAGLLKDRNAPETVVPLRRRA